MITARMTGADSLRSAARDLRRIRDQKMTRAIRGAVRKTIEDVLPPLLKASAAAHVPSGYAPVLAPSMRVKTTTKLAVASGVGVTVTVYAVGRGVEHRDVKALNAGRLRHPVYGRVRLTKAGPKPNPWVVQRVHSGMVDRPFEAVRPKVVSKVDDALSRIADEFNAGR